MTTLCGFRIVQSPLLEQDGEPFLVKRSWYERLFTRPWHPFLSERTIVPRVPYRGALKLDDHTILMHPAMVIELQKTVEQYGGMVSYDE